MNEAELTAYADKQDRKISKRSGDIEELPRFLRIFTQQDSQENLINALRTAAFMNTKNAIESIGNKKTEKKEKSVTTKTIASAAAQLSAAAVPDSSTTVPLEDFSLPKSVDSSEMQCTDGTCFITRG